MDVGKEVGGTAAVSATRLIAAPDPVGLLTPRGELGAADSARPSLLRTPATATASSVPVPPTVAELSKGAQLLLRLLNAGSQPGPSLPAPQPLLPSPPSGALAGEAPAVDAGRAGSAVAAVPAAQDTHGATLIARALQAGLESSGLFYESHLADWVAGQRSLESIRAEPQAALHSGTAENGARTVSGHLSVAAANAASSVAATAAANATASAAHSTPANAADGTRADTPPANGPTLNTIVNAQLDVIDSGQLHWRGELWPGMPAELWLQRDAQDKDAARGQQGQGSDDADASGRRWQARLVTTLPSLGKVSTQFTLQGEQLALKLACAQPATAAALQSASAQLSGSLQASGIRLQGFASHVDDA